MHIAHLIPYLGRAQGGPVMSLAAYGAALANRNCGVSIFGVVRPSDGELATFDPRVHLHYSTRSRGGSFRWSPELWSQCSRAAFDVIHSHCLWTDVNRLAGLLARTKQIPHLLAPCGHLQPSAMRRSWWKKLPCKILFQSRALREASCLHAKSETEYEELRALGMKNPIAVIPNPVPPPQTSAYFPPGDFKRRLGLAEDMRIVLYMGRIHPVKGILRLVRAWAVADLPRETWRLVLAGPDEGGYRKTIEEEIVRLSCGDTILFTGPLRDQGKWDAYAAADLFILASDFENFGLSIAEALLSGLPVITTTGTPWKVLAERGIGWWCAPAPEALARAVEEAVRLPEDERLRRGNAGKALAEPFRPDALAAQLEHVYRWLLEKGDRPDCVRLD